MYQVSKKQRLWAPGVRRTKKGLLHHLHHTTQHSMPPLDLFTQVLGSKTASVVIGQNCGHNVVLTGATVPLLLLPVPQYACVVMPAIFSRKKCWDVKANSVLGYGRL
jgi:hypothetical protein